MVQNVSAPPNELRQHIYIIIINKWDSPITGFFNLNFGHLMPQTWNQIFGLAVAA
jgi:hypothetical protein